MSKETINITLDHFKPKAAAGYGWRNHSEKHMKLHFTVEVLDEDGNEIVNKKFRGYGPYPYKHNIDFSYSVDDGLKTFLIEEVRSSTAKPLFKKVIKSLLDSLKQACDDAEIEYWNDSWSELFDKKPIAEIPLKDIEIADYPPKYQKKIIKLILKDKSLFEEKTVGEGMIKFDAKAGYKWVESGAITQDEFVEMIDKNDNRVFTKAETKFLSDKELDRGSRVSKLFGNKDDFDIKVIADNLEMLKAIKVEDIAKFAERLSELPKNSAFDDKYKAEKGKILTYILTTKSWFDKNKQLPASKDWKLVLKAIYNGEIDNENKDFPVWNGEFSITEHRGWEDYWLKDVLDLNSPIVDIFADLWVAAYCTIPNIRFKGSIFAPMIYNSLPINRKIVEKAINVRATHNVMQKHYKYIEEMGLVDEYENVVFPAEVMENTNPQTEDEKVEFMISMLSVDYWDNDSAYEATGEVDAFYKLVEECKSNNELARKVNRKLSRLFINENLPGKPNLNSSKIDLLSNLHTSLDFGVMKTLCSHLFIEMYEFYERSSPLALACWEKLIDRPEAYCGFNEIQNALKEHAPHLFEKFVLLTPPKPESYEEFWESGKLKESGARVCEREGLATSWRENGQKESETSYVNGKKDGLTTLWYENGQKHAETNYVNNKEDGLTTLWHENGQKSAEVNYKDGKQEGLATWWYEDGQKSEFNYKDGKHEGLATWWYESGSKSGEANFFYGERNGTRTLWDKDGNVTFLATYNIGESNDQNGLEPQYDDENDLTHYIEYKDGVVINEKVEKE